MVGVSILRDLPPLEWRSVTITPTLAIEFPERLSDPARAAIRDQVDDWLHNPGRPLLLDAGARLVSIDAEGRVSRSSDGDRRIDWWWALAAGFGFGSALTGIVIAVAS
jgi:hypothetical protein